MCMYALRHDIDQIPFSVCNIFDDVDDSSI